MYIVRKVSDLSPKKITCGIMRELTKKEDFKGMNFVHVTIKDSTKKHYHKKLTEIYYVLKGSIKVEIDGKIEHLDKDSMIIVLPKTKHEAWSTSKEDAELLVICCPPWSEEDEILLE